MRKLTLSAEADVIEQAKRIASQRGTSVSAMFSQFVRSLTSPPRATKLPGKTGLASGLIKLPQGKTARQLIEDAMAGRFMR